MAELNLDTEELLNMSFGELLCGDEDTADSQFSPCMLPQRTHESYNAISQQTSISESTAVLESTPARQSLKTFLSFKNLFRDPEQKRKSTANIPDHLFPGRCAKMR